MDPVPDPILTEKFLGYSRESNPGPLGWQSDVLTTIPNRRSKVFKELFNFLKKYCMCRAYVGPIFEALGRVNISGDD